MPIGRLGSVLATVATALTVWMPSAHAAEEVEGDAKSEERLGSSTATGDFDGDGFVDLAVGVPRDVVRRDADVVLDAGAVNVVYGSVNRLQVAGNQRWTQDRAGIAGLAEEQDYFGAALATGDFDGDGYHDLAIGVPGEAVTWSGEIVEAAGAVNVLFGSPSGLQAAGDRLLIQGRRGVGGRPEGGDSFGTALAAGNLGRGRMADLAIGVPSEDLPSRGRGFHGVVQVVHGSATGLSTTGDQVWSQDSRGLRGQAEPYDQFGAALAIADFGRSGRADLAIGVPAESLRTDGELHAYAGAVHIIYGREAGLDAARNQVWTQNTAGIRETAYSRESFGAALAAGNFGKGRRADIAVGVPYEHFARGDTACAGAVAVIYGSENGLVAEGDQLWTQDSPGIAEEAESEFRAEAFGNALAAGRLNADDRADLVVGVCEDQATEFDLVRGAAHVIHGSLTGLHANNDQLWTQDSPGVPGVAEHGDDFACTTGDFLSNTPLTTGNFGPGRTADLVVGVIGENPTDGSVIHRGDAGAFNVIYSSSGELRGDNAQFWRQQVP
jgi:hypothetical protein